MGRGRNDRAGGSKQAARAEAGKGGRGGEPAPPAAAAATTAQVIAGRARALKAQQQQQQQQQQVPPQPVSQAAAGVAAGLDPHTAAASAQSPRRAKPEGDQPAAKRAKRALPPLVEECAAAVPARGEEGARLGGAGSSVPAGLLSGDEQGGDSEQPATPPSSSSSSSSDSDSEYEPVRASCGPRSSERVLQCSACRLQCTACLPCCVLAAAHLCARGLHAASHWHTRSHVPWNMWWDCRAEGCAPCGIFWWCSRAGEHLMGHH